MFTIACSSAGTQERWKQQMTASAASEEHWHSALKFVVSARARARART